MGKFKVGDRVRRTEKPYEDVKIGTLGTITAINNFGLSARVKVDGRKSDELATWGFDYIELCNPSSIHITVSGNDTIAVLKDGKNVVKRVCAKCSPEDTFDFNIGAEIAFGRLFGKEPFKACDSEGVCKDDAPCAKPNEFKVGDKVIVKTTLKIDGMYDDRRFVEEMKKYCGKETIVEWVDHYTSGKPFYKLSCCDGFSFTNPMLIPFTVSQVREVKRKAEVGEWVKIVDAAPSTGEKYKNGDVMKIIFIEDGYWRHYGVDSGQYLNEEEYVVLENYNPHEKTYTQSEVDALIKAERDRIYNEVSKVFKEDK